MKDKYPMKSLGRLVTRLDRLKGSFLRLSMRMPQTSQHTIAKHLGFDGEKFPELDPHVQMLLGLRKWLRAGNQSNPTPAISRLNFIRDMAAIADPIAVGSVKDWKIPSRSGQLDVRHYTPLQKKRKNKTILPLLIYFHGGSFIVGDLDTHDDPCRLFCQHGQMQVLSVRYRLMPENPSPAAIEDCVDAIQWVYEHITTLGADPHKISVGGDSAGGNLAAVLSQLTAAERYAPVAQLLIYPSLDLVNTYPSHRDFGEGLLLSRVDVEYAKKLHSAHSLLPFTDPRVSPMLGNLAGLPPALIVTAAFDSLRDEAEIYAIKMREAGSACVAYRVESQGHGFVSIATINRAALHATIQIAKDFRTLLDGL